MAASKRSYAAVKTLGFKGSYTSFEKKIGAVHKPAYTLPGFGGGLDNYKAIGKLPKPKGGWTLPGHNSPVRITIWKTKYGIIKMAK